MLSSLRRPLCLSTGEKVIVSRKLQDLKHFPIFSATSHIELFISMLPERAQLKHCRISAILRISWRTGCKSCSKTVIPQLRIKRTLQGKGFYRTAIMDMTVEDSSACVLWKRTGLFLQTTPLVTFRVWKRRLRAFLSSTSGAAPLVYHSTFDHLSSNQDPDLCRRLVVSISNTHQHCTDISFRYGTDFHIILFISFFSFSCLWLCKDCEKVQTWSGRDLQAFC